MRRGLQVAGQSPSSLTKSFPEWREQKRGSCVFTLDNRDKMRIFFPFQYPVRESSMATERRNPDWSSSLARSRFAADDRFDPTGLDIMLPGTAGAVM